MQAALLGAKTSGKAAKHLGGLLYNGLALFPHQRQQGFGKAGQVPLSDARLVVKSVAPTLIDGAEDLLRVELLHEGAGAVIDGVASNATVVGVHHTMNKAQAHPACHQCRLAGGNGFQQGKVRIVSIGRFWVVASNHMVGQRFQHRFIATHGSKLEGAHADMAASHTGQDGPRLGHLAYHALARRDGRQGAGGGYAHGGHELAHQVFAKHRAKGRTTIATPRKRRAAAAF